MKWFWQWKRLYKSKEEECKKLNDHNQMLLKLAMQEKTEYEKVIEERDLENTVNDSLRRRIDHLLDVRIKNETRIDVLKNVRDSLAGALSLKRQTIDNLMEEIDRMTASQTELEKKIEELKQHVRYYKRDELGRFM